MEHHEWGWMIVVYLFVGGLGAGSLVLSAAAFLSGRARFAGVARAGALVAPVLVGAGSGLLVFDLGKPFRAWKLFVTIVPVSPMSIGSWLLVLFTILAGVNAVLHLPPSWARAVAGRVKVVAGLLTRVATWNETVMDADEHATVRWPGSPAVVGRLRTVNAVVGIPLGIGVGIYTGVLLGAIPARPFWNTPMVAQLFLFSALSTATALMLLLAPRAAAQSDVQRDLQHRTLLRADLVFIFFELFLIVPFVIHGELSARSARQALEMILGGPYTAMFWVGVVSFGILVPMLVEAAELFGAGRRAPAAIRRTVHLVVPVLILVGGYLLRWVFVHAGQDTLFL